MQKLCIAALTAVFLFTLNVSAEDKTVLAEVKGIYAEQPLSEPDSKAVQLINQIINRFYKKKLPLLKEYKAEESLFVIGNAAVTKGLITVEQLKKASPGGFAIKCSAGSIAIVGVDPWATVYGVGRFAERLGFKYRGGPLLMAKSHTDIPAFLPESLEPFTIIDKPAFGYRNGRGFILGGMFSEIADCRKGADSEIFKKTDQWIDHTAGYLVPKDLYYDEHPEYYAMLKNGKRITKKSFSYHRTSLCLSNPEVLQVSLERTLKWIENEKDKKFFFITNGDTNIWCKCEKCLKLDEAPGETAARLLHWVNYIAKNISPKYPDKVFFTFAYAGSDKAPLKVKPAENVCIIASTGLGNIPFYNHEKTGKSERYIRCWQKQEGWLKACTIKPLVCEYIGGVYQPAFINQTADRYRDYKKKGIGGIAFTYGMPKNFKHAWWYLHSKLLWNPYLDELKLVEDFAMSYYGPAGEAIGKYFNLMYQQYQATLKNKDKLVENYPENFYFEDFIKNAVQLFTEAEAAEGAAEKMKAEIAAEKALFLEDALKHLSDYSLGEKSKAIISYILDNLVESARKSGKFVETVRDLDVAARNLARRENPLLLDFVRSRLGKTEEFKPEKLKNGLRFSPAMFQGADKGPEVFDAKMSHKSLPCPPKFCAGVLAKAKTNRGIPTSTVMTLKFTLDDLPEKTFPVLELWGQDAVSKWGRKKQLTFMSQMLVTINGKEIYKGECGFVRGNWSGREFKIPAGVLQVGNNKIAIKNITSKHYGAFAACWVLVSDVKLIFREE